MKNYYVELTGIGESHLNEEEIPTEDLNDNEALIKAEYSMISSGTELSRAFGLKKGFSYPVRPGYCMVGRVLEKGKDIKAEKGDLVFVNAPHASLVRRTHGNLVQGPLIFRLPQDIDPIEATAINLLLVAIQGVNLSSVRLGSRVGVFGLGNIGILVACMYKKLGCDVTGIDPVQERCDLAKSMGIEKTVCAQDPKEFLQKAFDISIDVTGLSPVIIHCVENTVNYGEVILLGSPRQSYECDITPLLSMIHMKNLTVKGAFNNTTPVEAVSGSNDSLENNLRKVCELICNKDIDISRLISKVIDPKDCEQAYYDLMYNKDKVNLIVYDWRNY
ncbi:MAG: zinc-binding alcohol dehydrogenase [Erysipelotrichaceae bacterium]|nr:zinc-binding alcohol dehydrogenase [Erysipelotrichaceae bacterium]